jgi:hypothetical protein
MGRIKFFINNTAKLNSVANKKVKKIYGVIIKVQTNFYRVFKILFTTKVKCFGLNKSKGGGCNKTKYFMH